MAFVTDEDKALATEMLKKGQGVKEILAALDGRAKDSDIYYLKSTLKKRDAPTRPSAASKPAAKQRVKELTIEDERFAEDLLEKQRRFQHLAEQCGALYRTLTNGQ